MPRWIQIALYRIFPSFAKPLVTEEESNIGHVLHDMGLVSEVQIQKAVLKRRDDEQAMIGMCFVRLGFITSADLNEALDLQKKLRNGKAIEAKVIMIERHMKKHPSSSWQISETAG